MQPVKRYMGILVMAGLFLLSFSGLSYRPAIYLLTATLLILILDKIGNGIVLREFVALFTVLTCLLMPILGYEVYTVNNFLSGIFLKYMRVPEAVYFPFVFPAVCLFCIGVCFPLSEKTSDDGSYVKRQLNIIKNAKRKGRHGVILLVVGILASFIEKYLPSGLQFFVRLIYMSSFTGFLYVYYSEGFPYRKMILYVFSFLIIYEGISSGMFTIVAYMGITLFSIVILGKQYSLIRKVIIFCVAFFLFVVLQNTKLTYRRYIWVKGYDDNRIGLFANLFWDNIQRGNVLFEKNEFFPVYTRTNQGFNISLVMKRIPALQRFDNGSRLVTVFFSAIVPRFLWPDKPEAGGKFNMQYYAGAKIKNYSTNVGPVGEAYGSFGEIGGIIYMFGLGLLIRWFYVKVFVIARKKPIIILWIPVLFFQVTYAAENDTLQIINSLLKGAFYIFILYKIFPEFFNTSLSVASPPKKQLVKLKPIAN